MNIPTHFVALRTLAAVSLLATLGVAGCGGGGTDASGSASAADTSSTTAAAPAAPAAAPAPAAASAPSVAAAAVGSTCGIPDFAAAALLRVNQLRAAGASCGTRGTFAPAGALTTSTLLTQAAEAHSRDMLANNFFSHTGSTGSTLATRVDATGYAWSALGENIAAGQIGLEAVLAAWMASDGHCANVMNPSFNQIGLVCVPGVSSSTYRTYWTMDLGRSR